MLDCPNDTFHKWVRLSVNELSFGEILLFL